MNILESMKMAWFSIMGNKLRSFLTALGIIFGVGAVIALVSIGQGATMDITNRISSMGTNLITITSFRNSGARLQIDDAAELLERVPSINAAVPSITFSKTIKWNSKTYDASLEGVNESFPEVRNVKVATGRFFEKEEVEDRQRFAVIGNTVVEELFENVNPIGQSLLIDGQAYSVIGILEEKGSSMGRDSDDIVIVPITLAQRLSGSKYVNTIYLQAKSAEYSELAVNHVTAIFTQKFKRENMVRVSSQDELLETINTASQTMSMMLGAIAGISLLVGGIGIMNIMLVSVTERTREIGIRKALGAKSYDILRQFLVESVFLSVSGGIIGILLGAGISKLITYFAGWQTMISGTAILISFSFAMAVGLFFGGYPAYKAAHLDPIVALRHE